MKHIMTKIAKEILEQKEKEQIRLLQEAIDEACKNDDSHTRNLTKW